MKKTVLFAIIILILFSLLILPASVTGKPEDNPKLAINGYVISNMPTGDFISNYPDAMPGLDKVNDASELANNEYTDNENDIPVFAKVNLFSSSVESKKEASFSDLIEKYGRLPETDYYGKESIISAINSAYYVYNVPAKYETKAEPKIEITYKKISAGKRTSYIPVRKVVKTNLLKTVFLLNPYSPPVNERINRFDFCEVYDVNPCFSATIAQRKSSGNSGLDFAGFFVDLPDVIPDSRYASIVSSSLKKFSDFVHDNGKFMILENLNTENYEFGKYGDIIGIKYPVQNAVEFLKEVRMLYPDKLIFATIDSDFSDTGKISNILGNLALFGIYPEFGRDTSTGDFLYYESKFGNFLPLINRYTEAIKTENGFAFVKTFEQNGFEISKFVSGTGNVLFAIKGGGKLNFAFRFPEKPEVVSINGTSVNFKWLSGKVIVNTNVNGLETILVKKPETNSVVLLGMIPEGLKNRVVFLLRNLLSKQQTVSIKVKSGKKIVYDDTSLFLPLSEHLLNIRFLTNPLSVSVAGESAVFSRPAKHPANQFVIFLFVIALLGVALFQVLKKKPIKKPINVKQFILLLLILPAVLVFVNRYFIHYSIPIITFFVFSLMFLILAFYDIEFQKEAFIASFLLLVGGFLLNLLYFETLLPHFFDEIIPFQRYNMVIYMLPFIFSILFFGVYGKKHLNKWEILLFIMVLAGLVFWNQPLLSPFVLGIKISVFYPVAIVILGGGLLGVFHKNGFSAYAILYAVMSAIFVMGIFASRNFYSPNVIFSDGVGYLLIMKDFFLFSLPFYFFLLFHHSIVKESPVKSVNIFVFIAFSVVTVAGYASLWGIKFAGSDSVERLFSMPAYILIVFLMSMILMEPINNKNSY